MAVKDNDPGVTPRVHLIRPETETLVLLTIGADRYRLTKAEANELAAQLAFQAGEPAKLSDLGKPLAWEEDSPFVRAFRAQFNENGEFS